MKNTKTGKMSRLVLTMIAVIAMLLVSGLTAVAADTESTCTEHSDAGYVEIDLEKQETEWVDNKTYESVYDGYVSVFLGYPHGSDEKTIESEVLELSPGEEYVFEFDWGINQYFVNYGGFEMNFYHNGERKISREYTTQACEVVETIVYEFTASDEGDTFTWEFNKVSEMTEENYNSGDIMVSFTGKDESWVFNYTDGEPGRIIQIHSPRNTYGVNVYFDADWLDVNYLMPNGITFADHYRDGVLSYHEVSYYFSDSNDFIMVQYNADKTVEYVQVHSDMETDSDNYYFYLSPDGAWYENPSLGSEYLCGAPLGYIDATVEYFVNLAPCIINCAHENITDADCYNPASCSNCAVNSEGSEPLGHDMVIDKAVEATCTEYGYTEGTHCSRCNDMTVEQIPIEPKDHDWDDGEITTPPTCIEMGKTTYTCNNDSEHTKTETDVPIDTDAHAWDNGEVTTPPTCTEKGVMTYTCTHSGEHTYTSEIDALGHTEEAVAAKAATCTEKGLTAGVKCSVCDAVLTAQTETDAVGHKYDNACDASCNECNSDRSADDHKDEDEDLVCDECEATLEREGLSGGAIAAISIGSALTSGLGGFAIFWFLIKKKKFSDLVGVFKKSK